jgi:RNA polymerase sigma-70 factor (ECF subfamily)
VEAVAERANLAEIYAQYGRSVYRRALALLGDPEAAKDATHEVFLRIVKTGGPTKFDPSPMAWLYRVTTNLCLNSLRDARKRGALLAAWKPEPQEEVGRPDDADTRMVVRRILAQIPEDLQEIAIYYYVDDLTREEIADIVGLSRRTIGNRLASFHSLTGALIAKGAGS